MKKITKIILVILVSFIVSTSFGINRNTVNAEGYIDDEIVEELINELTLDGEESQEVIDLALNIANGVAGVLMMFSFAGVGGFAGGAAAAGGFYGMLSLIYSILGPLMGRESGEEALIRRIFDKLANIDNKLSEIDNKLTSIDQTLFDSLAIVHSDMNRQLVLNYKTLLDNYNSTTNNFINEINTYNTKTLTQMRDWYLCNSVDELYIGNFVDSDRKFNIKYTEIKEGDNKEKINETISIDIDGQNIIDVFKEVKTGDYYQGWDPDKADEILRNIFTKVQDKYLSSTEKLDEAVSYKNWLIKKLNMYSDSSATEILNKLNNSQDKDIIKKKFVDACCDSLITISIYNIAGTTTESFNTYADKIISEFGDYCNRMSRNGYELSPIDVKYKLLSTVYGFQGDLNCKYKYKEYKNDGSYEEKEESTNFAKLSAEQYKANINKFGAFAAVLAKAANNNSAEALKERLYKPWAKALLYINKEYDDFYKKENGNPVNNYSFLLKQKVQYEAAPVKSSINLKYHEWTNGFGTDIESYQGSYIDPDWSYGIDDNSIISTAYMDVIYNTYRNMVNNGTLNNNVTFVDYLKNNGINVDTSKPLNVITHFYGGAGFTSGDSFNMFVYNVHDYPTKYANVNSKEGDVAVITGDSDHMVVRSKAVADVFNLIDGTHTLSYSLGAVASFYNSWTFKDDCVLFWDADYYGNTTEKRKELYSQEEHSKGHYLFDIPDEPKKNGYTAYVDYSRYYGSLVKENVKRMNFNTETSEMIVKYFNDYIDKYEIKDIRKINNIDELNTEMFFNDEIYDNDDEETINKFIDYSSNENNLKKMINEYFSFTVKYNSYANMKEQKVSINKDTMKHLVNNLIRNELGCEIITNLNDLPSSGSENIELILRQEYTLCYKLFIDDNGDASYDIEPLFDVKPILIWDDKEIEVNDRVLKETGINSLSVKLPILIDENANENMAEVYHYSNINQIYHPDKIYYGEILKQGNLSYTTIKATSFSPFYINSTFFKGRESKDKYVVPNTSA